MSEGVGVFLVGLVRRRRRCESLFALAALLGALPATAQAPLDVLDPTPRDVLLQFEISANLATVGQTFGPTFPATYSVSGNTGTLVISTATHELIRSGGGWSPVPGSFTPIVFAIDLTTLEATSQPAGGQIESGPVTLAFTQNVLDTTALGGFMGPDVPSFFCTSQQEVDDACLLVPIFCGQVCTIVPGSPYDPATGRVNLIGSETQTGCDGAVCSGPFDFFTAGGDLQLSEAPGVPALSPLGALTLAVLLAVAAARGVPASNRQCS